MPKMPPGRRRGDQRWSRFLSNHAKAIIACDFLVALAATFRSLYVFVLIYHQSRQLLHINVIAHPTAAWTLQQVREAIGFKAGYRYLIHERNNIFAKSLDASLERLGLKIVKSPPRSPMAKAYVSHCTSFAGSETTFASGRLSECSARSAATLPMPKSTITCPTISSMRSRSKASSP